MSVTPEDIAVTLGLPVPAVDSPQWKQWQRWIDDALLLLRVGDGTHDGFGDLSQLDQATLDYVVTQAVAAMVRRPDDATQVSVSVDDANVSRTYSTGIGRVGILDIWWAMLAGQDSDSFSIGPMPGEVRRWVG